jgi:DegV family protein with EDD domain
MALTLSATAAAVRNSDEDDICRMSGIAAEATVLGAKGNSGLILAHWFQGLYTALGAHSRVNPSELAQVLCKATQSVYDAIDAPVEGTILTVMREVSDASRRAAEDGCDFFTFMDRTVEAGEAALARTPEQLDVLREAHVVDAGAQGYLNFMIGARRALRGEPIPQFVEDELHAEVGHDVIIGEEESPERFCTELIVRGKRFNAEKLRRRYKPMGSSLMVATTGTVFKLHIHTNHPDEVMRMASKLGTIEERKVDDMWRQQKERRTVQLAPLVPLGEQPATVAVLCDTTADLPADVRREMGIESAPLQIMFGDEVFRDQVDLSSEEFYRRLQSDPRHPTTSQPAPREFVEALDRIRTDREAIVITISSRLSGTFRSAQSAAELVEHPRVEVFDSGCASLGYGLMTLNAARLAARGASMDEVLAWLERWRDDTGLLFSLRTLEYLRRGGRIGAARSMIGKLMGLQPILGFEDGNVVPLAKARGKEEAGRKVSDLLEQRIPAGARIRLGLVEIGYAAEVDRFHQWLDSRCRVIESIRAIPTGVIGVHAGPGAWGLFYQLVRDDDPLLD